MTAYFDGSGCRHHNRERGSSDRQNGSGRQDAAGSDAHVAVRVRDDVLEPLRLPAQTRGDDHLVAVRPREHFEDDVARLSRRTTDVFEHHESPAEQETEPGAKQCDRRTHEPPRLQDVCPRFFCHRHPRYCVAVGTQSPCCRMRQDGQNRHDRHPPFDQRSHHDQR